MKKRLPGRRNPTIKRKLVVLIGGQLLLFCLILYALFFWFQDVLEEKVGSLARQTVKTVTGNLEIHFANNIQLSHAIVSDASLIRLLRDHPDFSESSSVWAQVQLLDKLKNLSAGSQYVHAVSIFNPQSGKMLSTAEGLIRAKQEMAAWVREMESSAKPIDIRADLEGEAPFFSDLDRRPQIMVLRKIPGKEQDNLLMIHIGKQVLNAMIGDSLQWERSGIVITDSEGRTVFRSGAALEVERHTAAFAGVSQGVLYETVRYQGESYIAVRQHSELTDWNVMMLIPQSEIMQDVFRMQRLTLVIVALLALFFTGMTFLLYTQIFNPIKKLHQGMVTVEKGLPFRPLPIKRMDELGFLQQRFNAMVVNEQQMRTVLMEEKLHKKEIELKLLQSQVNPHFLYNTLDSIYWVAIENGADEIGDVVLDLSRYFRLSLSRGKEFVTIRETVEHLEYYLRIQQFRHTDKIDVKWHVDLGLDHYRIMKLMLQPVVENAIIHGLERAAVSCLLTIRIDRRGEDLEFRVCDTGVGMNRSELKDLLREIKRQDGPSEATYGLRNLYHRLRILYGDDMRFQISSAPDIGTRVTIRIRASRLEGEGTK